MVNKDFHNGNHNLHVIWITTKIYRFLPPNFVNIGGVVFA